MRLLLVTLGAAVVTSSPTPPPLDIVCPAFIETTQEAKSPAPQGWTAGVRSEGRNNLEYLSFFEGPPERLDELHSQDVGSQKKPRMRWELSKDRAHWVACNYMGTDVTLRQPLPLGLTRCELTHAPEARWKILAVHCW